MFFRIVSLDFYRGDSGGRMRKRIKSQVISITPDIGTIRRVKSKITRVGDNSVEHKTEIIQEPIDNIPCVSAETQTHSSFSPKSFWLGAGGGFSKRAFFFSLFAFTAFVYLAVSMIGLLVFDEKLGLFILGCNAAFGLNYYKNERDKGGINGQ
jgi:hypothetical protein